MSVIAALAVVAAFVCAVLVLGPWREARVAPLTTASETVIARDLELEPARDESPRTVYPFSVIPGGVYSAEEFAESVAADSTVAAHYGDVMLAAMHVETVDAPREAYMSYRVGDQIYWTKRKIALHGRERVLSDGSVTIRARCGNRLSDEPMVPTSDAEPPVQAFEGDPAPPVVAVEQPAVPNGGGPKLSLAAIPALDVPMEPLSVSGPSGSVPFIGGIGWFGGPGTELSLADAPGGWVDELGEPPNDFVFPPSIFPIGDGPGSNPTDGWPQDPPTSWEPPSDHPPNGGPFGEPLDVPTGLGDPSGDVPPPVVPEPTSLTLFGTGAVWVALKRYRQRKRQQM